MFNVRDASGWSDGAAIYEPGSYSLHTSRACLLVIELVDGDSVQFDLPDYEEVRFSLGDGEVALLSGLVRLPPSQTVLPPQIDDEESWTTLEPPSRVEPDPAVARMLAVMRVNQDRMKDQLAVMRDALASRSGSSSS